MPTNAMQTIHNLVADVARRVNAIEKDARTALQANGNEPAYRQLMRQKAELLASLYETCQPTLAPLPDSPAKTAVQERLMQFSKSASTALELNSVFYMSALLYPEDHVPGSPNDLERFIEDSLS